MSHGERYALLIGADPYTIRACLKNCFKPVLVHGPLLRSEGYVVLSEEVETISTENPASFESVLSSLRRSGVLDREFAFVHTSFEELLLTTAALGAALGSPAIDPNVAVLFRDKWLQKKAVTAAHVKAAASQVIDDIFELNPDEIGAFTNAVLKPIAGGGTRNTSVVRSRDELVERCAEYRRNGIEQRTFVLEEFVAGDEWMVDGVVFDDQVQFISVGSYAQPCLSAVESNSPVQLETFDPDTDADVYHLVRPTVETAIRALGLNSGVFHMELFAQRDAGTVVFGECAARIGGGLIREHIQYKFGVDLNETAVLCAAGIDPQIKPSVRPEFVGSTYVIGPPGILIGYPSPAEVKALPGVEFVRLELPYGVNLTNEVADTNRRVGQVMLSGNTRAELRARRESLVQWFDERILVMPTDATNRGLRDWQKAHWPESASYYSMFSID